jgi:hypothetical protein
MDVFILSCYLQNTRLLGFMETQRGVDYIYFSTTKSE